jgi:hypothetical protein
MAASPAMNTRSQGTCTSSKYSTASFSSKRLDGGLSKIDPAERSYDFRERIFSPLVLTGIAIEYVT